MKHSPDISILVVGHNSRAFLPPLFASLAEATNDIDCEVLFINNGTDDSESLVAELMPDARVLPSQGNIGFAAANNYLARHAGGHWLLLLNPDAILLSDAISPLLRATEHYPHVDVFGGVTVDADGNIDSRSVLHFPTLWRTFRQAIGFHRKLDQSATSGGIEVDAVSGAFMLVRRRRWEHLGGMDDSFFLYAEELDFCRRHSDAGGSTMLVPAARILHDIGSGDPLAPQRIGFLLKGVAHYYRKHHGPLISRLLLAVHGLGNTLRLAKGCMLSIARLQPHPLMRAFWRPVLMPWRWWGGYR
ncbi:glycosyltransferase family 2 protein [Aurantiacibacter gangjinensis]|uniref:Glycosyltransferase 2-like domain-containing protein n=1 Tax=Aurantiacibacter gangjinensis TaxID=502682 RepID=A0A0G9MLD8_9SPHN|nr:glycosyltransferase family 2 protein [Aurantiacibacter gangjinensis]APE27338.1 Glycosyl transferase, family 2 [Aurantiacibacter gangjinensis]KLE31434.1 hypothetical protein AAW01_07525 [Aurantiacibacter gangjinensis]